MSFLWVLCDISHLTVSLLPAIGHCNKGPKWHPSPFINCIILSSSGLACLVVLDYSQALSQRLSPSADSTPPSSIKLQRHYLVMLILQVFHVKMEKRLHHTLHRKTSSKSPPQSSPSVLCPPTPPPVFVSLFLPITVQNNLGALPYQLAFSHLNQPNIPSQQQEVLFRIIPLQQERGAKMSHFFNHYLTLQTPVRVLFRRGRLPSGRVWSILLGVPSSPHHQPRHRCEMESYLLLFLSSNRQITEGFWLPPLSLRSNVDTWSFGEGGGEMQYKHVEPFLGECGEVHLKIQYADLESFLGRRMHLEMEYGYLEPFSIRRGQGLHFRALKHFERLKSTLSYITLRSGLAR